MVISGCFQSLNDDKNVVVINKSGGTRLMGNPGIGDSKVHEFGYCILTQVFHEEKSFFHLFYHVNFLIQYDEQNRKNLL